MIVYRITSKAYARDLSGTGARLYGGRWNSKGVPALYTSGSLSLATLETIANLSGDKINNNLHCVELSLPDELPVKSHTRLPKQWNSFPYTAATVSLGDSFFRKGGFCLKVPSAIIPAEFNYLFNPMHDLFDQIKLLDTRPFLLDQRLLK